ncbi:hypothetical protein B0H14DRAFT_3161150, partial [Mycena olivaceomarginata]
MTRRQTTIPTTMSLLRASASLSSARERRPPRRGRRRLAAAMPPPTTPRQPPRSSSPTARRRVRAPWRSVALCSRQTPGQSPLRRTTSCAVLQAHHQVRRALPVLSGSLGEAPRMLRESKGGPSGTLVGRTFGSKTGRPIAGQGPRQSSFAVFSSKLYPCSWALQST